MIYNERKTSSPSRRQRTSFVLFAILTTLPSRAEIPPDLRIGQSEDQKVVLSWSDDDSEWIEWYPETSEDLEDNWQPVGAAPDQNEGRFCLEQNISDTHRYFRLCRSPVFFVDDSNPTSGDGSLANPFQTINLGLNAARQSFIANGRRPVVYVFEGDYTEAISINATGLTDYRLTLMDSSTPLDVNGTTVGGFGQVARLRPPSSTVPISVSGLESFALLGFDARSQNSNCVEIDSVDDANLIFNELEPNGGDGFHCLNSNLFVNFPSVGVFLGNGDDGIEVINNDGIQRQVVIQTGNFGFGLSTGHLNGTLEHGIKITATNGRIDADISFNTLLSKYETITTTDGGLPRSLLLSMRGNSPLTTSTPGVLSQSITGSGPGSTVIQSWRPFYQVTGSVLEAFEPGGLQFDRVTFDADGDPANGITQVHFDGTLNIGAVPPLTIIRVLGPGLAFLNCAGDLRIDTLEIANRGAPALVNDTGTLNLDIDSSTFNTVGN